MSKRVAVSLVFVLVMLLLQGCLSPRGDTLDEKRSAIQRMKQDTLSELYRQRPSARELISKSAGYAVFSNVTAQYIFVGGGGGYGVAVNQATGRNTYMKMVQADLGLGLGVQDIRVVFVFHSPRAFHDFITRGWEFGAQADAAARAQDKGVAATGEISIDTETTVYTMSEAGLMAKVNLAGTKYWVDDALNNR